MSIIELCMCGGDVAFLSNYFEHLFGFVIKSHQYYILHCVSLFHIHFNNQDGSQGNHQYLHYSAVKYLIFCLARATPVKMNLE